MNEGKKEVFAEAKGEGFDVKVLREEPDVQICRVAQPLLAFAPTDPTVRRYRSGLFRKDPRRASRLRKQDRDERDEQESLLDLYLRAMESAGSSQARAA